VEFRATLDYWLGAMKHAYQSAELITFGKLFAVLSFGVIATLILFQTIRTSEFRATLDYWSRAIKHAYRSTELLTFGKLFTGLGVGVTATLIQGRLTVRDFKQTLLLVEGTGVAYVSLAAVQLFANCLSTPAMFEQKLEQKHLSRIEELQKKISQLLARVPPPSSPINVLVKEIYLHRAKSFGPDRGFRISFLLEIKNAGAQTTLHHWNLKLPSDGEFNFALEKDVEWTLEDTDFPRRLHENVIEQGGHREGEAEFQIDGMPLQVGILEQWRRWDLQCVDAGNAISSASWKESVEPPYRYEKPPEWK
jgi:hypothetical protein